VPSPPVWGEREGTHRGVSRKPGGRTGGDGVGVGGRGRRLGFPHLTPALSAPKGGEGVFSRF
jgi:hypothetical protein